MILKKGKREKRVFQVHKKKNEIELKKEFKVKRKEKKSSRDLTSNVSEVQVNDFLNICNFSNDLNC